MDENKEQYEVVIPVKTSEDITSYEDSTSNGHGALIACGVVAAIIGIGATVVHFVRKHRKYIKVEVPIETVNETVEKEKVEQKVKGK